MRAPFVLSCIFAGLAGALASVQGCSADESVTGDGPDAAESGVRQVDPPVSPETGPPCDPRGDLFRLVRDASIGDGASTTGVCLGCAKAKCAEANANCAANCPCQAIVSRAIECYLTTQQIGCAADLADILVTPTTRKYALQVLGCAQSECPVECAVDAGTPADPDAGAGMDASTD